MPIGTLEIVQILAMILAAGTPATTYYVMLRMHKQQIGHITENCKVCRKSLDEKIEGLDTDMEAVELRQKTLREIDLPDKYAKRRELEALEKTLKDEKDNLHRRIDKYHPVT